MKLILIMALTVDGKIARHKDHYPDWTGAADKRMFKQMTQSAGVVIMGSKTHAIIGKMLPNRLNVVLTRQPQIYQNSENLIFCADPPSDLLADLEKKGFQTAALIGGATINSLFIRERLIDEIVLTLTPRIFGQGLSLFSEAADLDLVLLESKQLEPGYLMIHYRVHYPDGP